MIEPKIGMRLSTVAISASTGQYFSPTIAKPIAESTPFTRQMMSCPRTTPERPRSIRASRSSNDARALGLTSETKKLVMRSRVSIMYAASISVMPNTKKNRLTPAMMSRPIFTISSALCCA